MGNCRRVGKGTTILAFGVLAGFIGLMTQAELGTRRPPTKQVYTRTPEVGDVTTFAPSSDGRVFVFEDESAFKEWLKLARASDIEGMTLTWATPAVNTVESGIECRVLSSLSVASESLREVRALGGPFWGRSFLVRTEDLVRLPQ